jgi:hypothetical protein
MTTDAEEDLSFIDEAGFFQGRIITVLSIATVVQIGVVMFRDLARKRSEGTTKRKQYEYVLLLVIFGILFYGGMRSADKFGYKEYTELSVTVDSENVTIDTDTLKFSCTNSSSSNHLWTGMMGTDTDPDDIKTYFRVVEWLAFVHFIEIIVIEIAPFFLSKNNDNEKEDGTMGAIISVCRLVVEPIVQAAIIMLGAYCIAPFAYRLQNPPCNYQYTELLHSEQGAYGIELFVVGYTMLLGSQTLKIYRHYAGDEATAGSFGRENLLG